VVTLVDGDDREAVVTTLRRHGIGDVETTADGRTSGIAVDAGPMALQRVLADLGEAGIRLHDAGMRRPTLDDVFLRLTGHAATAVEGEASDATGGTDAGRASRPGRRDRGGADGADAVASGDTTDATPERVR